MFWVEDVGGTQDGADGPTSSTSPHKVAFCCFFVKIVRFAFFFTVWNATWCQCAVEFTQFATLKLSPLFNRIGYSRSIMHNEPKIFLFSSCQAIEVFAFLWIISKQSFSQLLHISGWLVLFFSSSASASCVTRILFSSCQVKYCLDSHVQPVTIPCCSLSSPPKDTSPSGFDQNLLKQSPCRRTEELIKRAATLQWELMGACSSRPALGRRGLSFMSPFQWHQKSHFGVWLTSGCDSPQIESVPESKALPCLLSLAVASRLWRRK